MVINKIPDSACFRCFKFNSYNPVETGYFCSVRCELEYAEKGSLIKEGKLTEGQASIIYKNSLKEEMLDLRKYLDKKILDRKLDKK